MCSFGLMGVQTKVALMSRPALFQTAHRPAAFQPPTALARLVRGTPNLAHIWCLCLNHGVCNPLCGCYIAVTLAVGHGG